MAETSESLIYEEARDAIHRQQAVVESLRARAGGMFGAASLVTAFLGGQALVRDSALDVLAWIAIGGFVGLFGLVLAILWPWQFRFVLSASVLIEEHLEKPASELQTYLSEIWDMNYDQNKVTVDRLFWLFRIASACLALEVVAWLIRLGTV